MSSLSFSLPRGCRSSPAAQLQTLHPRKAFWAQTAALGLVWGAGRQRAPAAPPFSLRARLMAAAVPAALRGSQAASQSSQHCRGCLLFFFS